jgi:hypothetical protein
VNDPLAPATKQINLNWQHHPGLLLDNKQEGDEFTKSIYIAYEGAFRRW